MKRVTFAIIGIAALMLAGCGKAAPAAVKAVTGQGAKAAPKALGEAMPKAASAAPKAVAGAVPKAAKPAQKGGFWSEVGKEAAPHGLEYGVQQLREDDKKKR